METISNRDYYCSSCGAPIRKEAQICPKCGVRNKVYTNKNETEEYSTLEEC